MTSVSAKYNSLTIPVRFGDLIQTIIAIILLFFSSSMNVNSICYVEKPLKCVCQMCGSYFRLVVKTHILDFTKYLIIIWHQSEKGTNSILANTTKYLIQEF